MKKGLISIVLVAAMLTVMSCGAFAYDHLGTLSTIGQYMEGKLSAAALENRTVKVETNIQVKNSDDTEFSEGPIVVRKASSADFPTFDFKTTLYMGAVKDAFVRYINAGKTLIETDDALSDAQKTATKAKLDAQKVKGEFLITITYPTALELPADFLADSKTMEGFSADSKRIFKEKSRATAVNGDETTLTITVEVQSPDGANNFVTKAQLEDASANYFSDMTIECSGVKTSALTGSAPYKIKGTVTGATTVFDDDGDTAYISYNGIQQASTDLSTPINGEDIDDAWIYIYNRTYGGGSGGGSNGDESIPKTKVIVMFDVNSDTTLINGMEVDRNATINLDEIKKPTKAGYIFDGFYEDTTFSKKLSGEYKVTKDTVLYSRWIEEEAPDVFNDEHLAYIAGYPDGTIKPLNNISREEVATILYRLLKIDARTKIYSATNSFSDVDSTRWSNEAVSTMANGGYIKGYEDGTFKPENNITRAEFVTIVARFTEARTTDGDYYRDIDGHWAKGYIQTAADKGWLEGYADGTFRPDEYITRADVIKIMNNMLNRHVDAKGLNEKATQWSDNPEGTSYYYDILEATNSHNFERSAGEAIEKWTELVSKTLIVDKTFAE